MDIRAFGSEAQGDLASGEDVDPRYATARDAAMQSFFNRFGRFPTQEEFSQSIGHFLPVGVTVPAEPVTLSDAPSLPGEQVAQAASFDPPVTVALEPGASSDQLFCKFNRGRYDAWAQMAVRNTPSANFRRNTLDTRPMSLPRPPIIVDFEGELLSASRSRPFTFQLAAEDRVGQAINRGLGLGVFDGPGQVSLKAANHGPFVVDVTLGVRPAQ